MPTERAATCGADVEIVEQVGADEAARLPAIKPCRVRINGTDVGLVQKGSLVVDVGDGLADCTTVTLTLLARSVSIRAE